MPTRSSLSPLPQIVEGSTGAFGSNGLNFFGMWTEAGTSGPPPPGIDQTCWAVFTRSGTTSFDLPLHFPPMPMFGKQDLFCELGQPRFGGYTFDYDAFFSGSLGTNFMTLVTTLTEECSNENGISLFLQ